MNSDLQAQQQAEPLEVQHLYSEKQREFQAQKRKKERKEAMDYLIEKWKNYQYP